MTAVSRAAVAVEPGRIELDEFPLPAVGDDDALLEIEATGLCGSDLSFLHHPSPQIRFPFILGHESVGRIAAIGPEASRLWGVKAGDRVAVEEIFPCRRCRTCRYVNYHLCERPNRRYGVISTDVTPALWGGFSQYMHLHPDSLVYPMADHVPVDLAPLFIPLANGIKWVTDAGGLRIGQTMVVQGPGAHGLGCVAAGRSAGASLIVVCGRGADAARLDVARKLGADLTIDIDEEDPVQRVREVTGYGADLVIDVTANAPAAFPQAIDMCAIGGTVVQAGVKHRPVEAFDADAIFMKELTVRGVYGRDFHAVEPAIRLLEADADRFRPLVTHAFPLDATAEALRTFAREGTYEREPVHVCITPNAANDTTGHTIAAWRR